MIFIDNDAETEDLFEQISLGSQGEALNGGIRKTGKAQSELACFPANFELGNPLRVGPLQRVRDTQQGREFGHADAIIRVE